MSVYVLGNRKHEPRIRGRVYERRRGRLEVAVFADEAELLGTVSVVPGEVVLGPDVDAALDTEVVVRLMRAPVAVWQRAVGHAVGRAHGLKSGWRHLPDPLVLARVLPVSCRPENESGARVAVATAEPRRYRQTRETTTTTTTI